MNPPPKKRQRSSSESGTLVPQSGEGSAVLRLVPKMRELISAVPQEQRGSLHHVWRVLRPIISNLEKEKEAAIAENLRLRSDRAAANPPLPPFQPSSPLLAPRPDTTSSIMDAESALDVLLNDFQQQLDDADALSVAQGRLFDMPTDVALNFLQERRDADTEAMAANPSCWLKLPDSDRYPKINLRNTVHHSGGGTYGQVFMHHLAVVAGGRGETLRSVTQRPLEGVQFHVSHLCNNERCFNPEHAYVEAAKVNEARKTCAGRCHIDCGGCGAVYEVCPHARFEGSCAKDCILPRFTGEAKTFHRANVGGFRANAVKE